MSSIKDIASEAGVSTATVSHVINKTRFVSEKVRARVFKAIELHNYYPNAHARSLASGSSRIFGLVISDIANPFFPELVKSIETAAYEHGYDVVYRTPIMMRNALRITFGGLLSARLLVSR